MTDVAQGLTVRFYEWERRGRGWQVYGQPVDLEPPFEYFNRETGPTQIEDDGYVPGILDKIKSLLSGPKPKQAAAARNEPLLMAPNVEGGILALKLSLPKGERVGMEAGKSLLLMLSDSTCFISYELVATATEITIQFSCREPDLFILRNQVKAYFPSCIIDEQNGVAALLKPGLNNTIIDLGLREEFMRPLCLPDNSPVDSLTGVFAVLDGLQGAESAIVQVMFKGAVEPWAESVVASVTDGEGDSFFMDASEMPKLAKQKVSTPLYGVSVRCAAQCESKANATSIAQNLAKCLIRATESATNSLILLNNDNYSAESHMQDVNERQSRRLGMLLNMEEIANMVHLPSPSIASQKLSRNSKKTKAMPDAIHGNGFMYSGSTILLTAKPAP